MARQGRPRLDYAGLLALAALDAAGYSIMAPVVPAIAAATGAGPGVIGALVACFAAGQLAGYPLAGRGVSRRSAASVLAASLVLLAVGDLAFLLAEGLGAYFLARLVQGVGAAGLWIGITFAVLERFRGQEYRRLTGVLAAYSIGGVVGPALGAAGGVGAPFAIHLGLVVAGAVVVAALGAPRERAAFASDRAALRARGFWLASAAILLVTLGLGTLEGPLPLHFARVLDQAEIAALYVGASIAVGAATAVAGSASPRAALAGGTALLVAGVAAAGIGDRVAVWIAAVALAAAGVGLAEAGALGVLLDVVGVERIVVAMVVWSQVFALGYLAGPALSGAVVEALGFAGVGLVPLAGALLVVAAFARGPHAVPARLRSPS